LPMLPERPGMEQFDQRRTMKESDIYASDYLGMIWRRKLLILAVSGIAVLATLAVSLLLPKYYTSEAVILATAPETGGLSAALSASPLAGALGGSLGGLSSPADKILVFLKSRTIAEMVIRRFDLIRVFNTSAWDREKNSWEYPARPPLMEDAVKKLLKKVTSFKKSKEGAITIKVEWKDPKLAADMANYYVAALAEFMKNKSINTTIQIVDPAVPGERKSSPRIVWNIGIAAVVSLLLGFFIALSLDARTASRSGSS
jgi:tyrosine-protein kinase Etk/Wzc